MIKFGSKVKCKVSGFTGIAVTRCEYLNGGIQDGVAPEESKEKPAEMPSCQYIDQGQLEVVGEGIQVDNKIGEPGGFMPDAPSH